MLQGIDHILIAASDLEAASEYYAGRLGFHLSGGGEHPGRGTRNRLAVLDPEYLELLAVRDPAEAPPPLLAHLSRHGGGLFNFAIASDDIEADAARLRENGLQIGPVQTGSLASPAGAKRGWKSARPQNPERPDQPLPFLIQHDSGGQERRLKLAGEDDSLAPHPNGATSVRELLVAAPSLAEGLTLFQSGYGLTPVKTDPPPWLTPFRDFEQVFLPLGSSGIRLLGRQSSTKPGKLTANIEERGIHLFALALNVSDLQQSRAWLESQDLLPPPGEQNTPEYIWLDNKHGFGSTFFLV